MKHFATCLRMFTAFVLTMATAAVLAQTTYVQETPKPCDAASHYSVTSFSQFACRGITYDSGNIELFFWGSPRIELFAPGVQIGPYTSTLTLTGYSNPSDNTANPVTPGTFAFSWSGTDSNGIQHSGTVSGAWRNLRNSGGWWFPDVLTSQLTISK